MNSQLLGLLYSIAAIICGIFISHTATPLIQILGVIIILAGAFGVAFHAAMLFEKGKDDKD